MKLLYRTAPLVALIALTACQTVAPVNGITRGPVEPTRMEYLSADHTYVIVDGSASMYTPDKFPLAKATLISMTHAAPQGDYNTAGLEYGHDNPKYWVHYPYAPFNRADMLAASEGLEWLSGTTPLAAALASIEDDLVMQEGRGVIIIFSDGETDRDAAVAAARQLDKAYHGELCIYGVHVGKSRLGLETLGDVSRSTGCGRTWRAIHVQTDAELEAMVREIFFSFYPDEDGDEVPDHEDKCPGTPMGAPVSYDGCWIINPIHFDTDKSHVKPKYDELLDGVADIMVINPNSGLWVDGHTDSTASRAYNQGLSQRRSESVKGELVNRGVQPGQLTIRGFSEDRPVATNRTSAGRQENRRVEIKVKR